MKVLFFILLFCGLADAQLTEHGVVIAKKFNQIKSTVPRASDSGKVLMASDSLHDPSWQPASGGVTVPLVLRQDTATQFNSALQLINSTGTGTVTSPFLQFTNNYKNSITPHLTSDWFLGAQSSAGSATSIFLLTHLISGNYDGEFGFYLDSITGTIQFSFASNTSGIDFVIPSGANYTWTFPINHGTTGQVLTASDNSGGSSWTTPSSGSPYGWKDDGGTPNTPPSVAASSRSLGAGDSIIITGLNSVGIGTRTLLTANQTIGIGTIEDGNNSKGLQASGKGSIAIGASAWVKSFASICIGWSAYDFQTSQVNDGAHGNNIVLGNSAFASSKANNSIAAGYSSECDSSDDIAIGNSAFAGAGNDIAIGENANTSSTHKFQIMIQSSTGAQATSAFDSTTKIGIGVTVARNTNCFNFGQNNTTTTGLLAQFSDGGADGNAATFDCFDIAKNGTATVGKNLVAGQSLGSSTTPTAGTYAKDNAIIAWGNIAANGTITSQYGNFGIAHTANSGVYTITLPTTPTAVVATVTPQALSLFNTTISGAVITVNTDLGTIAIPIATDVAFYFIVTGRP